MPDLVQRVIAALGLVATSPLLVAIAVWLRIDSAGPILFRARRIGQAGRPFTAWKFRTMAWRPRNGGPAISADADTRVTRAGRVLRRTRADELPQLWNVVRGEMRIVGPRPEDPRFLDGADEDQRAILGERPGITGLAQLVFADEARLLGDDPETAYRSIVLPRKILVDLAYVRHRSTLLDLRILTATALLVAGRHPTVEWIDRLVGSRAWRLP
jgi:lipopolysaccharide/colanic/teichoic acid biosynthesis glycosyltransferase